MWSTRPAWARPVRILARSCFSVSIDFAILSVAVFLMSAMFMESESPCLVVSSGAACPLQRGSPPGGVERRVMSAPTPFPPSIMYQGPFVFAHDHAFQGPHLENAEHVDRQLLVAAQGERGRVHHFEVLHERLVEGDALVARGALVLH